MCVNVCEMTWQAQTHLNIPYLRLNKCFAPLVCRFGFWISEGVFESFSLPLGGLDLTGDYISSPLSLRIHENIAHQALPSPIHLSHWSNKKKPGAAQRSPRGQRLPGRQNWWGGCWMTSLQRALHCSWFGTESHSPWRVESQPSSTHTTRAEASWGSQFMNSYWVFLSDTASSPSPTKL